jgi:hypothetical protein
MIRKLGFLASLMGLVHAGCGGDGETGGNGGTAAVGNGGTGTGGSGGAVSGGGSGGNTCPAGFADCDGDPKTVCEAALSSDLANCGACGTACLAGPNQEAVCEQAQCSVVCAAGFADCNLEPDDGCEAALSSDKANCGACGRDCGPSACSNGSCEVTTLASGLPSPIGIALDDSYVYWANFVLDGAVMRVLKTGGTVETLATNVAKAYEVAVDGNDLFFTAQGSPPAADASVVTMPKGGGTQVVIASGEVGASELWVDGQWVYWADTYATTTNARIFRAPTSGGNKEQVAAAEQHIVDLRVYQGQLYWLTLGTPPDNLDGALIRSELDGSSRTVLVSGIGKAAFEFGIEAPNLYFGSRADSTIDLAPLAGGSKQVLAPAPGDQRTVEIDGGFLYFSSGTTGTVARVATSGGTPITLASGQAKAFDLALDADYVYWTDAGTSASDGAIRRTIR